jgi:hypothetical protein
MSTNEAGTELDTRCAHLEIREHCLAPTNATSDEHRNTGEVRQNLLG